MVKCLYKPDKLCTHKTCQAAARKTTAIAKLVAGEPIKVRPLTGHKPTAWFVDDLVQTNTDGILYAKHDAEMTQELWNALYMQRGVKNMDNKTHLILQARDKELGEHKNNCITKRKAILDGSGLGKLLTKFKADVYKLNPEQQIVNEATNFDFLFDKYLTKEEFELLGKLEQERQEEIVKINKYYENIQHLAYATETYEQYMELLIGYDIIKDFRKGKK